MKERERASEREKERESFQRGGDRAGRCTGPWDSMGAWGRRGSRRRELRNPMDHLAVTPWEMHPHGFIMRITLLRNSRIRFLPPMTSLCVFFCAKIFQRAKQRAQIENIKLFVCIAKIFPQFIFVPSNFYVVYNYVHRSH